MATPVADRSSNKNEQIVHAAEVIGGSSDRQRVFREVYRGKTKLKTVPFLMEKTGLGRVRVLDAGRALSNNEILNQTKSDGVTGYEKIPFFQDYRDKILALAADKRKRAKVPTKRGAREGGGPKVIKVTTTVRIPASRNQAKHVTVDDIESFRKVRRQPHGLDHVAMAETTFKNGIASILGERSASKDWGGEQRDLSSSHIVLDGRRRNVVFAFKGPGKSGRLVPGKMGKNGDQIQRLVRCPAELFVVQYWGEIDDSVLEQLQGLVEMKSFFERRKLWYAIVDGDDSARLIQAYQQHFAGKRNTRKAGKKR